VLIAHNQHPLKSYYIWNAGSCRHPLKLHFLLLNFKRCLVAPTWTYPRDVGTLSDMDALLFLPTTIRGLARWTWRRSRIMKKHNICSSTGSEIPSSCCCHQLPVIFVGTHSSVGWFGAGLLKVVICNCRLPPPAPFVDRITPCCFVISISPPPFFNSSDVADARLGPRGRLPYTPLGSNRRGVFHVLPAVCVAFRTTLVLLFHHLLGWR
jgi:hypothetical protein